MRWIRQGGPEAIQALRDLGEEPEPEDLPPRLEWERPIWTLYRRLAGQWRIGPTGPVGLDLGVFIPEIHRHGWDVDLSLELLSAIEGAMLEKRESSV